MGEHRRKADGRRVFSTEFKRTAAQRILTGEKTLAELSRELDISLRREHDTPGQREGRRHDSMLRPNVSADVRIRRVRCGGRVGVLR
jgi:transposase-like protein